MSQLVDELIPEWRPFRDSLTARRPEQCTACGAWTVHDIAAHNAGNAEELARVLDAHLEGSRVPPTRSFEEREPTFRNLSNDALLQSLDTQVDSRTRVLQAATCVDTDAPVPWTGREMKVAWFGEHMREELILHRWDMVGDDATSEALLSQPWLTTHSVFAVGQPLLGKGQVQLTDSARHSARLRSPGRPDVVIDATPQDTTITTSSPEGPAVIETDPAARVLLLWGRQPADPGRLTSTAGPEALGRARTLLSGY